MSAVDLYFKWMVLACLCAVLAYMVVYGLATRWYRSNVGRPLMIKAAGLGLMLTYSALFYFLGPNYGARDYLRTIGVTVLFLGLAYAFWALIRELGLASAAVAKLRELRGRTP